MPQCNAGQRSQSSSNADQYQSTFDVLEANRVTTDNNKIGSEPYSCWRLQCSMLMAAIGGYKLALCYCILSYLVIEPLTGGSEAVVQWLNVI